MKYLLLITAFLMLNTLFSQSIDLQLISSAGASSEGLEYSTGELITNGDTELTQGFHQGNLLITSIFDLQNQNEFLLYPNPTKDGIMVTYEHNAPFVLALYSNSGILVKIIDVVHTPFYLDIQSLEAGMYYIKIKVGNNLPTIYKVEKIH